MFMVNFGAQVRSVTSWGPLVTRCRGCNTTQTFRDCFICHFRRIPEPEPISGTQGSCPNADAANVWNVYLPIYPWKLPWNPKMEVWKMIFLFKQVIFRFHVNFPGCKIFTTDVCQIFHTSSWANVIATLKRPVGHPLHGRLVWEFLQKNIFIQV